MGKTGILMIIKALHSSLMKLRLVPGGTKEGLSAGTAGAAGVKDGQKEG